MVNSLIDIIDNANATVTGRRVSNVRRILITTNGNASNVRGGNQSIGRFFIFLRQTNGVLPSYGTSTTTQHGTYLLRRDTRKLIDAIKLIKR